MCVLKYPAPKSSFSDLIKILELINMQRAVSEKFFMNVIGGPQRVLQPQAKREENRQEARRRRHRESAEKQHVGHSREQGTEPREHEFVKIQH